jgi:ribosome maturation protein SDO1
MSEKMTIARLKKFGQTFEISVDADKALDFKQGDISDLREVLLADNIFSDVKKGLIAPSESLAKAFETTEVAKVAEVIIRKGEIQLSSEHRSADREQKRKKLIHLIHQQAINPATGLPHPSARIEAALEEGKIHLDDHHTLEEQFDSIISKLRPIIPLKIEQKQCVVIIPAIYAGKSYQSVKDGCKVLQEEWKSDGSWQVKVEMPAGRYQDFIDKLNSLTHGEVEIKEV